MAVNLAVVSCSVEMNFVRKRAVLSLFYNLITAVSPKMPNLVRVKCIFPTNSISNSLATVEFDIYILELETGAFIYIFYIYFAKQSDISM